MKRLNSNLGFTFIELIVVLALIIVLTTLAIPSILSYQRRQAESEEVKNFISTFRTTQNLSLTTDTTYFMSFSNAGSEINVCSPTNECKIIKNDYIRTSEVRINIDRYGNLVDSTGSLISRQGDEVILSTPSYDIKINKVGRIYSNEK